MERNHKIVVTCGEYDPLYPEDIHFLKRCKTYGNWLIVGIHSDFWLAQRRGGFMMNYESRREIVSNLKIVDEIFTFNDSSGTVTQLLKLVKICYPDAEIIYVSEQDMHNAPETKVRGITFVSMK